MNLDSFLAVKPVPVSAEPQQPSEGAGDGLTAVTRVAPESLRDNNPPPSEVTRDVTPNGIVIEYQSKPKRIYKLRGLETDWVVVPSVTTVLDLLQKGGLTVWGQRVGIQGVLSLFEQQVLTTWFDWQQDHEFVGIRDGEDVLPADVPSIEALMKKHKLTTNDIKESGGERGDIVHNALEAWSKTGHIPVASDFEEREFGYIEGLAKFLVDADPEPVRTEVMVGSVEHGFAGRYDIELRLSETRKVRKTPKQKWVQVGPGVFLVDGKSAKGVYPSTNFRQLAAYEGARIECGYEPTDGQYVLNVNGKGSYAFVKSTAVLDDFLSVLSVYRSDARMKVAA